MAAKTLTKRALLQVSALLLCGALGGVSQGLAQERGDVPNVLELSVPPAAQTPSEMSQITSSPRLVQLDRKFFDDFSRFEPNGQTWRHYYNHAPYDSFRARTLKGNLEQQLYVDPMFKGSADTPLGLNPFDQSGGKLQITGRKAPQAQLPHLGGYDYISGIVTTQDSFEQRYGYFEASMRPPRGQGLWSAFWLKTHGGHTPKGKPAWPPEVDIMEFIGRDDQYSLAVHWDVMPNNKKSSSKVALTDPSRQFHTYGMLWMPDQTVFYLDRRPVRVIETKRNHNVPMFMVLNLALGGRWPGPVDDDALPATLEVDWVAAYQLRADP